MRRTETMRLALVALLSAASGWWLADTTPSAAPQPAARALSPTAALPAAGPDTTPLVLALDDGNVTLRVEREPLDWVLAELSRQTGRRQLYGPPLSTETGMQPTAAAAAAAPCPAVVAPALQPPAAPLLQAIRFGTDAQRRDGLLQARNAALPMEPALLKTLFETDPSDEVRQLALEQYLEPLSGQPAALREALQAALYVASAGVQHEARRRLAELDESERIGAASPQKTEP